MAEAWKTLVECPNCCASLHLVSVFGDGTIWCKACDSEMEYINDEWQRIIPENVDELLDAVTSEQSNG